MNAPVFPKKINKNNKPCYPGVHTKKKEQHKNGAFLDQNAILLKGESETIQVGDQLTVN